MAYDYSELLTLAQQWAAQAVEAGWLQPQHLNALNALDTQTPVSLLSQLEVRPLIVAFMGGSGVGKSSLLNRLAGKAIAQVGETRPTSREVTLFHHQRVAIQQLPEQLPLSHLKIAQHDDDSQQHIIWLDMPDMDSTDAVNRQLVLQWLPHVDVLLYVVSPERYRDEKAWQLLLAEGVKHAWLFVLNQWDRGQTEQCDDFRQQLHKAGFFEPLIFKTCCSERTENDDFADLQHTLIDLAQQHTVQYLQQRNQQHYKQQLQHCLLALRPLLGECEWIQQLPEYWQNQWQLTRNTLQQGFTWSIQQAARYYAEHVPDLIQQPATASRVTLWDDWAQNRFDDALDSFLLTAYQQRALPLTPFKNALTPLRQEAAALLHQHTELTTRLALAKPGTRGQRALLKLLRIFEIVLPLSAMSWVGYQVFVGFYLSNTNSQPYLGSDFAIHSGILIALTWLVPFFLLQKSQPSLRKSAERGLQQGIQHAFVALDSSALAALQQVTLGHAEQVAQLDQLCLQCTAAEAHDSLIPLEPDSVLARMLTRETQ